LDNNGQTYGALQSGEHDFYIQEPDKALIKTSIAKFSHLWVLVNGEWKLKRVLSFDHQEPKLHYPSEKVERDLDAGYRPGLFGKETEIKDLLVRHKIPSLALGVIENGQLQQVRIFSAGGKSPMHGLYNVASLTKPVVALVALKLINDGRWNLDGSLAEHYVDADLEGHPMLDKLTTRHVLSHQTGFPNWRYQAKDKKLTFMFEPGGNYQYSGEGFEYLRKAIEAKFSKPFAEIAKNELLEPLDMSDTHFYWTDQVDQSRYQPEHDGKGNVIELPKHTKLNAADNLITSVEDFSKFMVYLLNGADLDPKLYKEMGNDSGTNALAIMLPNSKRGLVILSNSDNATKLWTKIVSEHYGDLGKKLISANLR